jgi:predicted ferric reductase
LYYHFVVVRRVLQLASLAALAGLSLFYPLIESLDGFDSPLPATDLEINVIGLLTFVGIAFVLAHVLASLSGTDLMNAFRQFFPMPGTRAETDDGVFHPLVTASPPLPLRI